VGPNERAGTEGFYQGGGALVAVMGHLNPKQSAWNRRWLKRRWLCAAMRRGLWVDPSVAALRPSSWPGAWAMRYRLP